MYEVSKDLLLCCNYTAPVATYLATRYSSRVVVATGSLLCSAAALLTSFAPNIYFVIGIYGGVTGKYAQYLYGLSCVKDALFISVLSLITPMSDCVSEFTKGHSQSLIIYVSEGTSIFFKNML